VTDFKFTDGAGPGEHGTQGNHPENRVVTIKDIAARAGVSISTVSRVINQSVPVDPATEIRVHEAIGALGYRPNLLARSFRSNVTHTIGLLVPDNSNPFFAEMARVIEDAGFEEGYSVILCNSSLSEEKQGAYVDVLLAKRVDGIVMTSTGLIGGEGACEEIDRICRAGVPCVVIDRDLGDSEVDQLLVDNHEGGYLAGTYLIDHGHRKLACVVGPSDLTPSAGRIAGFRRAIEEAGVDLPPEAIVRGNGHHDGGSRAVEELLRRGTEFTAIFAFNDEMAIGVIGTLQRAGKRVPQDVSVLGFDDIPYANAIYPALTTVAQPITEMARSGISMLLDRIRQPGGKPRREVLPTRLIERESVACIHVRQD
jgi:LacI family transcriptional regulator